jgi:hypothetical protein
MAILTCRCAAPSARAGARLAAWVFAAGVAGIAVAGARAEPPTEHQVKAAFLYNFAKFVEWPREAFADSAAPIVIGVLGPDPFGDELDRALAAKLVDRHPLQVRRCATNGEAAGCHVLFVGVTAAEPLRRILQSLADSPVLTVGESADFVRLGGIVRFVVIESKVRFEIHNGAAQRARLRLSSKLLRLALAVHGEDRR